VPDQPPGMILVQLDYKSGQTDQQLADAINSNAKTTTADGHAARDVEAPEHENKKPERTEPPVREGKRPGLAPDSGYAMARRHGSRSWIPRNSGSPIIVMCSIARVVVGTRPRFVTTPMLACGLGSMT